MPIHNSLHGKVIWITGASSGIGKALTEELAKQGALLIISARRGELLKEIANTTPNITPLPLDLTDEGDVEIKTEDALKIYGKIDTIVFNAGLSQRSTASSTPLTNTRQILEINFFSSVAIARKLLPEMKKNGGGRFVIISSLMGKFGAQQRSSYSASKHALHGYFESLRAEEWANNIHVTIAILGYINTEFSRRALNEDGSPYGHLDSGQATGMPTIECAKKIISGITKNKEEILIGGKEKYTTFLKRFTPKLLSKILRNRNIN